MSKDLFRKWPLAYPLNLQLFADEDAGGSDNQDTSGKEDGKNDESQDFYSG